MVLGYLLSNYMTRCLFMRFQILLWDLVFGYETWCLVVGLGVWLWDLVFGCGT